MKCRTHDRVNKPKQTQSDDPWWLFWLLLVLGIVLAIVIKVALRRLAAPVAPATVAPPQPQPPQPTHPTVSVSPPASTASAGAGQPVTPPAAEPILAVVPPESEPVEDTAPALKAGATPAIAEPSAPDDLTKIEGIGPKISNWLNEAGITTFAQLAAHSPDQLAEILRNAGHRIAKPDTWPEQAAFAAADQWEELAQFQDTLHGGRRK